MERTPLRRRRPAKSCIECRRRKVKCDLNDPCAQCSATRVLCHYRSPVRGSASSQLPQTFPGRSDTLRISSTDASTPRVIAQPSGSHRSAADHAVSPTLPWTAAASSSFTGDAAMHLQISHSSLERDQISQVIDRQDREQDRLQSTNLQQILSRLKRLEQLQTLDNALSETSRDILAQQTGLQDAQVILNKTRILRWNHWMGTAKEFSTVVKCYTEYIRLPTIVDAVNNNEIQTLSTEINTLIKACKELARRTKLDRPSRQLTHYGFDLSPPASDLAEKMVERYIQAWESVFRIVHVPSFRVEYQRFIHDPDSVTIGRRLKVLLVIAIGSSLGDLGEIDFDFRRRVRQWIYASQNWLSGPLEKDRLNITGIQVHCLTILARQIFSIGGDLVWMSGGSLIHTAMQIGLHRDPKHFSTMTILQAEVRRRLWATVLELAVQASLDSAMPPRIYPEEYDTEAPANVNDEDLDDSAVDAPARSMDTHTETSTQLMLRRSFSTRLKVVQLLNNLSSQLSFSSALSLGSEIGNALRTTVAFMRSIPTSEATRFHANLLDFLVRRFLIPLYCPFAMQARTNPLFDYALKASLDASLALVSPEPDEWYNRLTVIGGGLFRESLRCAQSVIAIELLAQLESQRLDGTLRRNSTRRDYLKQAMKDMATSALERVRLGETNVKGHMFLNMIVAQVESTEQGVPCELAIARSARESLDSCHDILVTQASLASPRSDLQDFTPVSLDNEMEDAWMDWNFDPFLSQDYAI